MPDSNVLFPDINPANPIPEDMPIIRHMSLQALLMLLAGSKEVIGIHVPLTRSLFGCDILSRLLRRVSLTKPTSAPLRF
jgi:hypothetical protein